MFKKLILTALAAAVLLTSTAFAYTDVPSTDPNYAAITTLTELGLMEGFEDGSFRPDDTITRAEAAKIMVLALNGEPIPNDSTPFIDVSEDPDGWINAAFANGIIWGCGDGTFRPYDSLTNEEAVKMMVTTIGYEPMAALLYSGYPSGYFKCAEDLGLLEGTSITESKSAITRRQLAELLYNSLEVDMMVATYPADGPSYNTKEGYTILSRLTPKSYAASQQTIDIRSGPPALFDGHKNSYWTCEGDGGIEVDLGEAKELGLIRLFVREYDDNRSLILTLEISEDGESWTPVGIETYGGDKGYSSSTELDAKIRYVRVNCNGTSVSDWVSLAEIEIYGK